MDDLTSLTDSAGPDLHQARKIGAAWADPGCALVPLSCLVFPFRGGSLGPLFSPVSSVSGLTFRGFGGCCLVGVCT